MSNYQDTCTGLGIAILSNTPTILWGRPGQGKSSVLYQIAVDYAFHLETVIASVREPSDFAGLPVIDPATGTVRLAPPAWARTLKDHERGMVFYDEISTAPPAVQAALLRPVLEGVVGELQMSPETRTVAAANPADIAAGGWDLAPPLANRFLHLTWSLPADVIREGFSVGWPKVNLPRPEAADVERLVTEARILVGSFLGVRPELATVMPEDSEAAGLAFPTPRSWEQAAKLYGFALACGANSNVVQMLLSGSVGPVATGEFITYVANLDLPDPEALLSDPSVLTLPSDRGDKVYAIVASVYAALSGNLTKERWVATGRVLAAVAEAGHGDIAASYGRRWAEDRRQVSGAMPTPDTVRALGPILTELGKLPG